MADTKVAIVTGAARPWGLGRAVAMRLAEQGIDVAVVDIRDDWGEDAAKEIREKTGRRAVYVRADMSRGASIKAMADQVVKQMGRIDILANVAAIVGIKRIDEITEEQVDLTLNINLKGPILACQAVLPAMRKVGGGHIVNVASGSAKMPLKGQSAYAASKAGLVIFTKILAWEVARDNVIVTCVAPGPMHTAMGSETPPDQDQYERGSRGMPIGRPLEPQEVADVVVYAATIANPALTGQTLHANGGSYMV